MDAARFGVFPEYLGVEPAATLKLFSTVPSQFTNVTLHVFGLTGIERVSIWPQRAHVRCSRPSSVSVAGFVTTHSPHLWPSAGMVLPGFACGTNPCLSNSFDTISVLPAVMQVGGRYSMLVAATVSCSE